MAAENVAVLARDRMVPRGERTERLGSHPVHSGGDVVVSHDQPHGDPRMLCLPIREEPFVNLGPSGLRVPKISENYEFGSLSVDEGSAKRLKGCFARAGGDRNACRSKRRPFPEVKIGDEENPTLRPVEGSVAPRHQPFSGNLDFDGACHLS